MKTPQKLDSLVKVSEKTKRSLLLWLKGSKTECEVYRIPKKYLYFNIANGRYADKMLQLKADNPGADIDPRDEKWKNEILKMLKGEYTSLEIAGTTGDKAAFERLCDDLQRREQINPGIILADGGVIDGNRRLAVLMSLDSPKFEYFEGVILPEDVTAEDRWRIEVGIQLGKDQQLDYSPINKLLKIREGLELYKSLPPEPGKKPEDKVAESLYGVAPEEVHDSIDRINLIDEYLSFFKMPQQYHKLGDRSERFIEAVKVLKAADDKLASQQKAKLKSNMFICIRENIASNWELREITRALGGISKARGRKSKPVSKAVDHLINHSTDPNMVMKSYTENKQQKVVEKAKTIFEEFKDIVEAERNSSRPISLAKDARTKLETLKQALNNVKTSEDRHAIKEELTAIKKVVKACHNVLMSIKEK